ncbi:MAG: hypothetical protein RLZZ324_791 [Candidatus Parcubacteria bacterium]|jgi:GT2 family glycosyltransferase
MSKVHIIIVWYDGAKYVDALFASLARMDRTGLEAEIVCVDNKSNDDTLAQLRARAPGLQGTTVITSDKNLGFAGGNNLAMRRALDAGAEYVYLLNQDTEVEPDFLVRAMEGMTSAGPHGRAVGAVQSLLRLHPEKHLVNSAGNAIHFLGLGYSLGYRQPVASVSRDTMPEISYPSGAGVLLSVAALRVTGLFDDLFFMYHEDLDLGWRLRLAGYRCILAPRSVVYHKYEFSRSVRKLYYMERNRGIVLLKDLRAWSLAVLAVPLAVAEVGLFVAALKGGWWREKLRAYAFFLKPASWTYVLRARRAVQKTRVVSDREIVRLFTPVIAFQDVTGPFTRYVANPLMRLTWAVYRTFII